MKRILAFILLTVAAASCSHHPDNLTLLVGTYTYDGSEGIYVCNFNPKTGELAVLDSAKAVNPSFLAILEDGTKVYAVNETSDSTASVETFARNGIKLESLGRRATEGADPCYISTNGKLLLAANYSGGTLSVFNLEDGVPGELVQSFDGTSRTDADGRQFTPHVHCAVFTPDGAYVLATDFSGDRILSYRIDGGRLVQNAGATLGKGFGPRHLTFSPDGRFVYCIGELSGEIAVFEYLDGLLTYVQTIKADPNDAGGSADIHISPDGKYLYASHRLEGDGISIFGIDPDDGTLTGTGYQRTGSHPRNFCLSPDGRFLLCACRDSNTVEIYCRDSRTGLLSPSDVPALSLSRPVFLGFI